MKNLLLMFLALPNVMNLKGELTPNQAKFMAKSKPDLELYDLRKDPFELHNLADDKAYTTVKSELLGRLTEWRKSVNDPGVSEEFRKGGWPSVYPTRSKEEWSQIVGQWDKWLFGKQNNKAEFPNVGLIPGAEPIIVN